MSNLTVQYDNTTLINTSTTNSTNILATKGTVAKDNINIDFTGATLQEKTVIARQDTFDVLPGGSSETYSGRPLFIDNTNNKTITSASIDFIPNRFYYDRIPSPESPLNLRHRDNLQIEISGKNIWNEENFLTGKITKTDDDWYYATSVNWRNAFGSSATYGWGLWHKTARDLPQMTISFDMKSSGSDTSKNVLWVCCSYMDGTSLVKKYANRATALEERHISITTAANKRVSYIYFSYGTSAGLYIKNFQIEFGATATTYESYQGQVITIPYKDNNNTTLDVYGGSLDIINGELIINEDFNNYTYSYKNDETYPYAELTGSFSFDRNKVFCNKYETHHEDISTLDWTSLPLIWQQDANIIKIYFPQETTEEEINTVMSASDLQIVTPRSTELIYGIEPVDLQLQSGQNVIIINADNIEAEVESSSATVADGISELTIKAPAQYQGRVLSGTTPPEKTTAFWDAMVNGEWPAGDVVLNSTTALITYNFRDRKNITSINAPNVTTIQANSFSGCINLKTANFPNVTTCQNYIFDGCRNLKSVYLPKCTTIGTYSFRYAGYNHPGECVWVLPAVTSINNYTFQYSGAKSIDLGPNCATVSGASAFQGSTNGGFLQNLILRSTEAPVTISATTFNNVGNVLKIYVPQSLIEDYKNATNWSSKADILYPIEGSEFEHFYADGTLISSE